MFTGDKTPDTEMDRDQLIRTIKECRAIATGFLGSVPGAMIVLDSQWHLVYLSDDAVKLFETDKASLIGRSLGDVYPKKLGHVLSPHMIKEILDSKEKSISRYISYLRKWLQISAAMSDFGVFIRLEDVTAEMLVNRMLRLNEFSVSSAVDMVFWIKPGGHIIYANIAAQNGLGYRKEELLKMKNSDIDPSYDSHKWTVFVENLRINGYIRYESNYRAKNGSSIPVEVTCNYLQYSGDEYLMAFARDIASRKNAENALKESKAEAELYLDLMSHDINNMNQVAIGYLELALDTMKRDGRVEQEQSEMISKPYEMLANSSTLIDNVRKIRRERSGHYKPTVMDLGKVIEEVIGSHSTVQGRDVKISFTQQSQCKIMANELLKDIFINLIGNSIKHSNGPLTINIGLIPTIEDGIAYCMVSVEDDGPGISDEKKIKLFTEISPEKATARSKGLGLYLIKQLVKDFKGRFWVEDRVPGDYAKGARFMVMLPAAE